MNGLKKKYYIIYIFLGYFAVSMLLQRSFVTEFPRHIHAWAHCDHYAVSKGFINNGFDFFHPETLVYNKQFANEDGSSNNSKVTAIDFPINNYIVAILMKVFNSDSPAIFRLYTLIVACIGLSFLFLISLHFTKNWIISFCIPIISIFTPVYLDYQVGFLPSISSLSLLFFSCYYFLKYSISKNVKLLVTITVGLTLAALIRTPYIIHLIALLGFIFFDQIINKKFNLKEWLIVLSGFILPALYFIFNGHLRSEYGSIFLSSPVIVDDWNHAKEIIKKAHETWRDHYFNEFQYIIIYTSSIALIAKLFFSKFHPSKVGKSLLGWLTISTLGVLAYAVLMIPQFKDHDYYFLDTFYPIIFIFLVYVLSSIKYQYFSNKISSIGLLLLTTIILSSSNSSLIGRRTIKLTDHYLQEYNSYLELEDLLIEHKISTSEKLLVIDAYAPNMPFILGNNSGYALIYRSKDDIIAAFEMDFKYITVSKSYFFNHLIKDYEDFHQQVRLVGKSNKLLLFEKHPNNSTLDLSAYVDLTKPLVSFIPNNENCDNLFANENGISDLTGQDFGLTLTQQLLSEQSSYLMHVTGEVKCSPKSSVAFVFDVSHNDENYYYAATELKPYIKEPNSFSKLDFYMFVNDIREDSKASFYIYNPDLENLQLKNIKVELF